MKTIIKMAIAMGIVFLFSGCTQPKFNPNNKGIMMLDGKTFRIPRGVSYNAKRYGNDQKSLAVIKQNRRLGLDCRVGDLGWLEKSISKRAGQMTKGLRIDTTEGRRIMEPLKREAISTGKMGCAHPLTDREYHYYSGQEREAAANARAKSASNTAAYSSYMNYRAATAPKTVNVQHSGYMNQNIQHSGYVNVYNR